MKSIKKIMALILAVMMCLTTYAGALAADGQPDEEKSQYTYIVEGFDWGPAVTKVIISLEETAAAADASDYTIAVKRTGAGIWGSGEGTRNVTAAYVSDADGNKVAEGNYITLEMEVGPNLSAGSPFGYDFMGSGHNDWVTCDYTITQVSTGKVWNEFAGQKNVIADDFRKGSVDYKDEKYGDITLTYAAYEPQTETKRPLVIWLHGAGEGGTDPDVALLGNKVVNLASEKIQTIFNDAYVLAPQAPTMWMNDGTGSYTSDGTSMYTEALMNLIETYVAETPGVDVNRIYLGGCSNGGFMTMRMILTYPEYFTAAYPICEAYTDSWITDEQIETIKDMPIWFTHAATDTTVRPATATIATYERLINAGAKNVHFTYWDNVLDTTGQYKNADGTPYEYMGHWSWIYTLNNECKLDYDKTPVTVDGHEVTIMEWLAAQNKNPGNKDIEVIKTPESFENVRVTITTESGIGAIKLYSETMSRIGAKIVEKKVTEYGISWTIEFNVGTPGDRHINVYGVSNSQETDTGIDIVLSVTEQLVEILQTKTDRAAVTVNEKFDINTTTSYSVKLIKLTNELGRKMGTKLVAKNIGADHTINWTNEVKIGTAGENRELTVTAANQTGDKTASDKVSIVVVG